MKNLSSILFVDFQMSSAAVFFFLIQIWCGGPISLHKYINFWFNISSF